jgi:hypothetical protein
MHKIFKARVSAVRDVITGDDREGRKQIYVTPIGDGAGITKEYKAYPPNVIPNSNTGGGVYSYPMEGQECVVALDDYAAHCQILSYSVIPGSDQFGNYIEANVPDIGGVVLKVGGYENAILALNPGGKIDIESNRYSRIHLDGTDKKVEISSMDMRIDYAGGSIVNSYRKEEADVKIPEVTSHVSSYKRTYEEPGFSDWEQFHCEKGIEILPIPDYVDKCVIRAGYIPNFYKPTEVTKHVYQIDTRQSTYGNAKLKDTTTELRIGYQNESDVFGDGVLYPAGTMLEWRAKRNTDKASTAHIRYGLLEGDTSDSQGVMGEIYRMQFCEDANHGDKFGQDIGGFAHYDPMGVGMGYQYNVNNRAVSQQYIVSFGKLSDDSLLRFHTHYTDNTNNDNPDNGLSESYTLGGTHDFHREVINNDDNVIIKLDESYAAGSYNLTLTKTGDDVSDVTNVLSMSDENINLTHSVADVVSHVLRLHNDDILLQRSTDTDEIEKLKFTDREILLSFITGTEAPNEDYIKFEEDKIELQDRSESYIVLEGGEISARSGDHTSTDNIIIDGTDLDLKHGNAYVTMKDDEIKLSVGTTETYLRVTPMAVEISLGGIHVIEFTSTGFTINGKSVVLETFLDWLSSNTGTLGMGNMGAPVPMFPSALTTFQLKNALPFAATPQGFKS